MAHYEVVVKFLLENGNIKRTISFRIANLNYEDKGQKSKFISGKNNSSLKSILNLLRRKDKLFKLSEQSLRSTANRRWVIDVNVVVLRVHQLLHERLVEHHLIYFDVVLVLVLFKKINNYIKSIISLTNKSYIRPFHCGSAHSAEDDQHQRGPASETPSCGPAENGT